MAHTGLEGAATLRDFWRGELIAKTIYIQLHRIPAAEIPAEATENSAWLVDRWLEMDRWLRETHSLKP